MNRAAFTIATAFAIQNSLHHAAVVSGHLIEFPEGNCKNIIGDVSAKRVGRVCATVSTTDATIMQIKALPLNKEDVGVDCHLTNIHFGNLPFVSPQGLKASSYTFDIPIQELEHYVCDFDEGTMVDGEVTQVCTDKVGGRDRVFQDYFSLPMICNPEADKNDDQNDANDANDAMQGRNNMPTLEEIQQANATINALNSRNFLVHTPKTGGISLEGTLKRFFDQTLGEGSGKKRVCRVKNKLFDSTGQTWDRDTAETGCVIATGEQRWHPKIPKRSFALMRSPESHVISQYFHCTESPPGRHRNENAIAHGKMLSMDEWLDSYMRLRQLPSIPKNPTGYFICYNPINLQAHYLSNAGPLSYPRTKEDLEERFEVVGITSEMTTSACLIFIELTGIVPKSCDCTGHVTINEAERLRNRRGRKRRRLASKKGGEVRADHGVTHHGDTFELSEEQRYKIEQLTDIDRPLYEAAKSYFAEKVQEVEKMYGLTLCTSNHRRL